tara:strand:- start:108 stop:977 length:870 start_codon:yes stop_codon:yes gene_type:complete
MNTAEINKYWKHLENKYKEPKYISKVKIIDFKFLKKKIDSNDIKFIKGIIRNLYVNKIGFIVKGAANKKLKNVIKSLAENYKLNQKSSFHKMYQNTPNFHRMINKDITKKYKIFAIKHSFFFYNWNMKSKLENKFKNGVYKHWRYIKFLSGNRKKEYEQNKPLDGQIDRLQIIRYPSGGGLLKDHVDPTKNQKIVSGLIMSKIGKDFMKGGFYFKNKNKKKYNIEHKLDIGDAVIFYGSIIHGVDKVDPNLKLNWKNNDGRWFIGMFVNDSDHVKNRSVAKDLSYSVNR